MTRIVIGSRGSALALAQANWTAAKIKFYNPGIEIRIEVIKTQGDKMLDVPLPKIGDKGLFVKEIEAALLEKKIDLAVHSMKDLPTEMCEGLTIGAIPERVDPSDVLLSTCGRLSELPAGARIGSSSLRRRAQILNARPNLNFCDIRGNLDTRIRRLKGGYYDAIIVAAAGLHRLGWEATRTSPSHSLPRRGDESCSSLPRRGKERCPPCQGGLQGVLMEKLPFEICLPAAGQGALAVQIRTNDLRLAEIVSPLNDGLTCAAVTAERSLLLALGGGCQTPIAALATPKDNELVLDAMVASLDGHRIIRAREKDKIENAEALGKHAAATLLELGARTIIG